MAVLFVCVGLSVIGTYSLARWKTKQGQSYADFVDHELA